MRCVLVNIRSLGRWAFTALGVSALGLTPLLFHPAPAPAARLPVRADDNGFSDWRGVSSCTSSACHNQAGEGNVKGREYALWVTKDPHDRAYQILFDERSVRIQENLNHGEPGQKPLTASRNILCLRCHVAPEAEKAVDASPVWFSDGVGCESCHGAAGKWLSAHMQYGWKEKSSAEKAAYGFNDTKNLAVRAKTCMDCHVGGNRADVNHDLYAAGHPPLQWEYSAALERYRPYQHWSAADDRRRHPAYETEAWAVGQAISARAALYLLDTRAKEVANDREHKPWPEFAEYGCASCHHTFDPQRKRNAENVHKAGLPSWSPFVDLTTLLPDHPSLDAIKELRTTMESRTPDPHKVSQMSEALAKEYGEWLKRTGLELDYSPDALRERLQILSGEKGQKIAVSGWDDARQLADALSAHYRSLNAVEPDAGLGAALRGLNDLLRPPPHWDTPPSFNSEAVVKALQDIDARLKNR
jgi:predicted CxxxxCH...CXXCH cytochrome family protein